MLTEKQIADRAVSMLTATLQSRTQSFANHVSGNTQPSLKDAKARATLKTYGTKKEGNRIQYLRRISVRMARHGFIQHYGVNNRVRSGGTRTRTKPKPTTYGFKAHYFNMKATPFLSGVVDASGIVPYVLNNLIQLRGEELLADVKQWIEK